MNPPLNVTHVVDGEGLAKVADFLRRVSVFGLDTETNVVNSFHERKLRTIQVGDKNEQYVIDLLAFAGSSEILIKGQGGQTPHPCFLPIVDVLRSALESKDWLKVGANLEFEYIVLNECLGLRPWNFYDVQIAEKNLHIGKVGFFEKDFWALDDLTVRYCGLLIDKSLQTSYDMESPLTKDQLDYAGLDSRIVLAVRNGQLKKIEEAGIARAIKIDNDAIPALADLHMHGVLLDLDAWNKLLDENDQDHRTNVARLDKFFIPAVGSKIVTQAQLTERDRLEAEWRNEKDREKRKENRERYKAAASVIKEKLDLAEECEGEALINYGSPSQFLKALRTMGYSEKKLKSSDDDYLKKLASSDKVVKLLDENGYDYKAIPVELKEEVGDPLMDAIRSFRETEKVRKTYGEWTKKHVCKHCGRIHSRFNVLGAETGRTSSTNPNLQNILKGKDWRSCFISRPGYKIIACDWNGQELRILAEISGEQVWIDAFNNEWDLHSVCAEMVIEDDWKAAKIDRCIYYAPHPVFGYAHAKCDPAVCVDHDALRTPFKNINFGIAYGVTEYKLSADLRILREVARDRINKWKATFKTVTKKLESLYQLAVIHLESRTLAGRRRQYKAITWEDTAAGLKKILKREPTNNEIIKKLKAKQASTGREGMNTPIQGTGAEMLKLAIGCGFDPDGKPYLWHLLPQYKAKLYNEVHDEIDVEAPDEHAEKAKEVTIDAMQRAGAEFVKSVVMIAEGKISTKWPK
jgi:DNA polymerase I-like protein with 3'-5' exonuclease and polymerase domains